MASSESNYSNVVAERENTTNVNNAPLSWSEAFRLFVTDLPALAERINYETEEVESLF